MHACKGVQGSSVFETKSRDTPIDFTHADRGAQTYLQGSEFKNFAAMSWTDSEHAASGIDESNRLFFSVGQTIPSFPTPNSLFRKHQFPVLVEKIPCPPI
jgi:hypothetical protein